MKKQKTRKVSGIYQVADGTWRAAIASNTGKRKYFRGNTRREVRAKMAEFKATEPPAEPAGEEEWDWTYRPPDKRAESDKKVMASLPAWARKMYTSARVGARSRSFEFSLSVKEFAALVNQADGRCMVSGIPFEFDRHPTSKTRPFAPSLDRINSGRGYEAANCRLVCWLVNIACATWGLAPVLRAARAIAETGTAIAEKSGDCKEWKDRDVVSVTEYILETYPALTGGAKRSATISLAQATRHYCNEHGISPTMIQRFSAPTLVGYPRSAYAAAAPRARRLPATTGWDDMGTQDAE